MRIKVTAFLLLMLTIVIGCKEDVDLQSEIDIRIEGNESFSFFSEVGNSRAVESTLKAGSEISLFSVGAFVCDGERLTFNGNEWKSSTKYFWQQLNGKADIHAYYPALSADAMSFYDENHGLKDILYATGSFDSGSRITLNFNHLFSEMTFRFAESINETLTEVKFKVSKKVTGLDVYTASLTLQDNVDEYFTIKKRTDATYRFLIPYSDAVMTIEIIGITNSGKERKVALEKVFRKGVSYHCNINERPQGAHGIFTGEDFIDFITLYNGGTVEGRTLEDFYNPAETVGGKRVFRLMNPLTFTAQQSARIKSIGQNIDGKRFFTDIFDGMNHTLYGIRFSDFRFNDVALFGGNRGEIKNLYLDNMLVDITAPTTYVSLLCSQNEGLIHNCMVSNSVVRCNYQKMPSNASLLVIDNRGTIYNCGVENSKIELKEVQSGVLTINNNGVMINNAIYRNLVHKGGNLCAHNKGKIYLTYVYNPIPSKDVYSLCWNSGVYVISDCFRNNEYGPDNVFMETVSCYVYDSADFGKVSMGKTDAQAVYRGSLSGALNYCIDNRKYQGVGSGIVLAKWTQAADGHPIFEYFK